MTDAMTRDIYMSSYHLRREGGTQFNALSKENMRSYEMKTTFLCKHYSFCINISLDFKEQHLLLNKNKLTNELHTNELIPTRKKEEFIPDSVRNSPPISSTSKMNRED